MKKLFDTIPKFRSYEEFLSSSWLAIRVATLTVLIMAIQNKKVIEHFSLYDGIWGLIHSLLWTGVTAFAILHFTVKLSKIPKNSDENKKVRNELGRMIILFAFIEFLLSVGYHILWFNKQSNTLEFNFPGFSLGFVFTLFLDILLPVTLYFYGHTVHIKTQTERELIEQSLKKVENPPTVEQSPSSLQAGDTLIVDVPGFGEKSLIVKELKSGTETPES